MQLRFTLAAFLLSAFLATQAQGQSSYQPGQTYSTTAQSTPAPVRYQSISPVTGPAIRSTGEAVGSHEKSLYNLPAQKAKPASKSPGSKRGSSDAKPSKPVDTATAKSTARLNTNIESQTKEVKSASIQSASSHQETNTKLASSTSGSLISNAGVPEPTDKLVFFSRKTGKKQIALTYDDGPNGAYTPKLMEFLKANNVPATFFLCGNMVKEYPTLAKQLADNGFELANHSYDHPSLNKLSKEKIQTQLQDTHDLVKEATGIDMKMMRPPFGAQNATVREVCEQMGYKIIQWDIDTEDWKKRSVASMVNTIMKGAADGSIILMHDRKHGGADTVLETTRLVVDQLRAKGFTFVTVGQLIELNGAPNKPETSVDTVTSATALSADPGNGNALPASNVLPAPSILP